MPRYLTKKRKRERVERNDATVRDIYDRAARLTPAKNLVCHQDADQDTKDRVIRAYRKRRSLETESVAAK